MINTILIDTDISLLSVFRTKAITEFIAMNGHKNNQSSSFVWHLFHSNFSFNLHAFIVIVLIYLNYFHINRPIFR